MHNRVTELEIRFTHQERTIQELSDIVFSQQQSIVEMQTGLRQLRDQMQQIAPSVTKTVDEEEPPPHY